MLSILPRPRPWSSILPPSLAFFPQPSHQYWRHYNTTRMTLVSDNPYMRLCLSSAPAMSLFALTLIGLTANCQLSNCGAPPFVLAVLFPSEAPLTVPPLLRLLMTPKFQAQVLKTQSKLALCVHDSPTSSICPGTTIPPYSLDHFTIVTLI